MDASSDNLQGLHAVLAIGGGLWLQLPGECHPWDFLRGAGDSGGELQKCHLYSALWGHYRLDCPSQQVQQLTLYKASLELNTSRSLGVFIDGF